VRAASACERSSVFVIYFVGRYVKEKLPKLFAHFKSLECDASVVQLMTTEWFLCIFCRSLPIETAFRIWDMFFYDGPKVMFRSALSIMKLCEEDLLKEQSELQIVSKLAELTNNMFDADKIIETSFEMFHSISRADLSTRRKKTHEKMARTVTSEASQSAVARIHQSTGISEKAAHSLLNDFSANHQSAPCLQENEGQMFATSVDYASFSTLCKSLFKWAAECYPLQNNAGASARTAMLLLFQALGGDTLSMTISFADMVIGFWQLLFGSPAERLKIAFQFFDTDRNGRLKRTNIASVLPVVPMLLHYSRAIEDKSIGRAAPEAEGLSDEADPAQEDKDTQLQLLNIELCQKDVALLFGDFTVMLKPQSDEGVPHCADKCKEIDEATFNENANSVAVVVEFFYLNRSQSRTFRSRMWASSREDELSFTHLHKFAFNYDRTCSMLLAMVKAEQWPKEEAKKGGFFFFSPKKSETSQAVGGGASEDALQFSGKAFVDLLLKIDW